MSVKYALHSDHPDFEASLRNIKSLFAASDESIHKARNELRIATLHGLKCVIKAFKVPHPLNRFVYAYLRDSKAKKSYKNALKLLARGIATPKPIGYIEFFENGLLSESYFISEHEPYDFTIREVLHHEVADAETVLEAFAAFTYALHQKGVWHEDYSPGNILIRKTAAGYAFLLVDINRMKFRPVSPQEGLQNFSKLWASPEDLTLLGKAYAGLSGMDEAKALKIIRTAARKTEAAVTLKKRLKGKK